MAIGNVSTMLTAARTLLQDTVVPYRYDNSSLLLALNLGMMEIRRLRFDLFLANTGATQQFSAVDTTIIDMDERYRTALLYYVVGHVQLRDDEDTQDARAISFLNKFIAQMTEATA